MRRSRNHLSVFSAICRTNALAALLITVPERSVLTYETPCTSALSLSTEAVQIPAFGPSLRPGGHDQTCRSHRRGGSRAHLPAVVSSRRSSAGLVRGGRVVRPFRLALHAPSGRSSGAGVRVVASRLLAHLEDVLERRGFVDGRESAIRGRGPDGRCVSGSVRVGVPAPLRTCGPLAGERSDPRRVSRLAGAGVGRLAEHIAGLRAPLTDRRFA